MMYLYHYSDEKHKVIQSLQTRNAKVTGDRLKLDAGGVLPPYSTSISFFLNTVPDNLPSILKGEHRFWQPKNLFEYRVDLSTLPDDIIYYIAETPPWVKFTDKFDWSKANDPEVRKSYMKEIRSWELETGLIGQGKDKLAKVAKDFTGSLASYYAKAYATAEKEGELEHFLTKYATYVPHVMIYHENFKIEKFKVTTRTLKGIKNLGTEIFKNNLKSSLL